MPKTGTNSITMNVDLNQTTDNGVDVDSVSVCSIPCASERYENNDEYKSQIQTSDSMQATTGKSEEN